MRKQDYIIHYTVKATDGSVIKSGKMRAKNKYSGVEAQGSFEKFLIKKYPNFGQLIVHSCEVELYDLFNNLFKNAF